MRAIPSSPRPPSAKFSASTSRVCTAVPREGHATSRPLSPGAEDLRVAHPRLAQDLDGVSRLHCGQHLEDAEGVYGDGRGPEPHGLRVGAESVADTSGRADQVTGDQPADGPHAV